MKKIKVVVIGVGNRGKIYTDYALKYPEEMEVIAVVDPKDTLRNEFAKLHKLPNDKCFKYTKDFLKANIDCDIVLNCTIDNLHYEISKLLLERKYNILLEKPITANKDELLELERLAKENGCFMAICHVLRYINFYRKIKKNLLDGEIGKITSIYMCEHVGMDHFIESFVVGKWKSEKECGSPFLLAKCCHDTDMMCWLNNETQPESVACFGDRKVFVSENAPKGHGERCTSCPVEWNCKYSVRKILLREPWDCRIRNDIPKPYDDITREDLIEHIKISDYGKCVYEDKDLTDRQNFIVKFKNGSIGTFVLVGGVAQATRKIHIIGEAGEIIGDVGEQYYTLRKFNFDTYEATDIKVDVPPAESGHMGGDEAIMHDLIRYLNGDRSSISITNISDSINGHLLVYGAEISRKEGKIVEFEKEFPNR